MERIKVTAIIGPTAVGKTALSLELAEELHAEIISVDSRQVYRYMDVGTDKASLTTRRQIPHHAIDVADPDQIFTVADFVKLAEDCVRRITQRGRTALFVGGTPFYYSALFSSMMNTELPHDAAVREKYEALAAADGPSALHALLEKADPTTAARLHVNDVRRVSRAMELFELTQTPPARLFELGDKNVSPFDVLYIGLNRPRPQLFTNIAARVRQQFAGGYPEEVTWLIEHGFDERFPSMQGFGYRELAAWYRGASSLEEALEGDIRRTKTFCRRQMTWFGKFQPCMWYDTSASSFRSIKEQVSEVARRHLGGSPPV